MCRIIMGILNLVFSCLYLYVEINFFWLELKVPCFAIPTSFNGHRIKSLVLFDLSRPGLSFGKLFGGILYIFVLDFLLWPSSCSMHVTHLRYRTIHMTCSLGAVPRLP